MSTTSIADTTNIASTTNIANTTSIDSTANASRMVMVQHLCMGVLRRRLSLKLLSSCCMLEEHLTCMAAGFNVRLKRGRNGDTTGIHQSHLGEA